MWFEGDSVKDLRNIRNIVGDIKKTIFLTLIFLIFVSFLSGCVGKNNNSDSLNTQVNTQVACENINIAFIYTDWCPHCKNMKPWVKELESEGYNITWINAGNKDDIKIATKCMEGVAQLRYVPEFVCLSKKVNKIGAFSSKEEMKSFFDNCIN